MRTLSSEVFTRGPAGESPEHFHSNTYSLTFSPSRECQEIVRISVHVWKQLRENISDNVEISVDIVVVVVPHLRSGLTDLI